MVGSKIDLKSLLKEAFEESNLPFRVDLLEWDGIPERFRENIKAEYVVISGGGSKIEIN
ncbi:hypothetical protein FACS1894163_01780 [Spirochaetia bacterium]|nr:hypothetical protein FACS1894163_01780 [Spirochaetia bacterium]